LASSPLPALIKLNDEKALAAFGYGQGLAAQAGRGLVIEAQERFAVRAEVDAGPDLAVGQEGKGIEEAWAWGDGSGDVDALSRGRVGNQDRVTDSYRTERICVIPPGHATS